MRFIFFLIFALIATVINASNSGDVITLNNDNFATHVYDSKDPILVEFHAPWCGHCKTLAPEYAKAATALKGKVKLAAIDATKFDDYNAKYKIQGFPTLKFFKSGDALPIEYDGERTADGIVQWVLKKSGK
jgi:protein disulfide-isomerase-like protein